MKKYAGCNPASWIERAAAGIFLRMEQLDMVRILKNGGILGKGEVLKSYDTTMTGISKSTLIRAKRGA